jgi:hypothetical protein
MSKSRTGWTRASARTGSVEVRIRPERALAVRLLLVCWRLRAELLTVLVGVLLWHRLTAAVPYWLAVALVVVMLAAALVWGPSRRWLVAHVWCTVTRHRLRSCLVQVHAYNRDGYVPWTVWVRPTNVGERLWLLMRPGVCVRDLEDRAEHIAAACWAREARIRRSRRLAALVTVDVVRRDVLAPSRSIDSPLPGWKPADAGERRAAEPASEPAAVTSLVVEPRPAPDVVPVPVPEARVIHEPGPSSGPVYLLSGEDVSDYV